MRVVGVRGVTGRVSRPPCLSRPRTPSPATIRPLPACSRRRTPPAAGRGLAPAGRRRSWLQAIASRIVCRRSGRSRPPPVSSGSRRSNRSRSVGNDRWVTRAAASSIARGTPSSRRQMSATSGALSSGHGEGRVHRLAALREELHRGGSPPGCRSRREHSGSGTVNGGTGRACSPATRSSTRLVTRILSRGQSASRSLTSGAAATTCSKLSSTSSVSAWLQGRRQGALDRGIAGVEETGGARHGGRHQTRRLGSRPAGRSGRRRRSPRRSAAAMARARRVLPMPPGPVRVRRRTSGRRSERQRQRQLALAADQRRARHRRRGKLRIVQRRRGPHEESMRPQRPLPSASSTVAPMVPVLGQAVCSGQSAWQTNPKQIYPGSQSAVVLHC